MKALENIKDQIDIIEYIKANTSSEIQKVGEGTAGVNPCPICGHNDSFRIHLSTNSWQCYSSDHATDGGDLIEFIKEYEDVKFKEAINIMENSVQSNKRSDVDEQKDNIIDFDKNKEISEQEKKGDFSFLIEKFHANVNNTPYFKNRGISDSLIDKYKLGYDDENEAVVLPCYKDGSPVFITKRLVDPTGQKYHNKGKIQFFNEDLLDSEKSIIFVTEGIFDALSIEEAINEPAIALNSSNNIGSFLKDIRKNNPNKHFILIADNDSAGQNAIEEVSNNSQFSGCCLEKYDDPNEYLQKGESEALREELKLLKKDIYNKDFNINHLDSISQEILNTENNFIETGFNNLDEILQGGLLPGVYVTGAITSLGKTTFTLQIADQIAESGQDVIFFSLEQSRKELVCKSLSREINKIDNNKLKSNTDLLNEKLNKQEEELLNKAKNKYREPAQHLAVFDKIRTAKEITNKVEDIIQLRDSKPVVIVDYLQDLEYPESNMSTREAIDRNLSHLKDLSTDYGLPMIIISSFNRYNYRNEVSFRAFKESGGIEYTADVVIGLQLTKVHTRDSFNKSDVEDWMKENPRKIQAIVLKNRNGPIGGRANFKYHPSYNTFEEIS